MKEGHDDALNRDLDREALKGLGQAWLCHV
jgi:hypothetical protein